MREEWGKIRSRRKVAYGYLARVGVLQLHTWREDDGVDVRRLFLDHRGRMFWRHWLNGLLDRALAKVGGLEVLW